MKEREGEKRSKEGRREKEETKFFTSCDTVTLYTHNTIMDRTTSHTNKTVSLYEVDYNHSSVGLLWYSTEVYPAEKNGQHYTVIMQHSLGNTVVYRLRKGEGKREQRRKVTTIVKFIFLLHILTCMCTHTTPNDIHTLHTDLEEVASDNAQPLAMVNHSPQVGVPTQNNLEYIQEEPQGVLVQEVHLEERSPHITEAGWGHHIGAHKLAENI